MKSKLSRVQGPKKRIDGVFAEMKTALDSARKYIKQQKNDLAEEAFIKAETFGVVTKKLSDSENTIIQNLSKQIKKEYEEFKATPYYVLKNMNTTLLEAQAYIKDEKYDLAEVAFIKAAAFGEDMNTIDKSQDTVDKETHSNIQKLSTNIQNESEQFKVLRKKIHETNEYITHIKEKLEEIKQERLEKGIKLSDAEEQLKDLTKGIDEVQKADYVYNVSLQQARDTFILDMKKLRDEVKSDVSVLAAYEKFSDMQNSIKSEKLDRKKALEIVKSGEECLQKFIARKNTYPTVDTRRYEEDIGCSLDSLHQDFVNSLKEKNTIFDDALKGLSKQLIILEQKARTNPKKYENVLKNALCMHVELSEYGKDFFGKETTLDNFEEKYNSFKEKCVARIKRSSEQGKFQEHRILSQTTAKILNFVLVLPLLALSAFSSIKHGEWRPSFFNTGKTDTHKAVDEVQEKLSQIKPS